ncbi:AraC family transcriptional regulator [Clostridium cellulovorans]|uniref:Transcriptional regulator, AraC family n=1 Tax=Clostridium cellulovorans (strain ATCC 35296 / DSM 3052 / OCM 3 / 743B) TaxID=573061 RepID=D9SL01_CLOC7|nr:AraC family transcriptional regulator [Clostridium cellulovorans]ADL53573.1 transcriptional regulator, AraC family [Clostridium cellulovorans 743B]
MCQLGLNASNFNPEILFLIDHTMKGKVFKKYHHHDFIEISIVLSGEVFYNIENKVYKITKGDILIFNPGVNHNEMLEENMTVRELHIGLSNFAIEGFIKNTFPLPINSSILILDKYKDAFFRCCDEILLEQQDNFPGYDMVLKSLVMKLLVILLRETTFEDARKKGIKFSCEPSEKQNVVKAIISYMDEHYMNDISLSTISENMYMSPVYISKIFKEETGDSPINYLIKVRLNKAKALLDNGELTVKAVAKSVGYDDAYYFSKLFKKYFGYPPSKVKS